MSAGEELRVLGLRQQVDRLPQGRRLVKGKIVHPDLPLLSRHAAMGVDFAFCSAAHTTFGVAGMVTSSWPTASVMALMTAAGAAIAPASPHPLMPSGLDGHLVTVVSTLIVGKFSACGIA